jgi:predicted TIM-barrel fold metal-dependent hydrolase
MVIDAHLHLPVSDGPLGGLVDQKSRLLAELARAGIDGGVVIADSETSSVIGNTQQCVELFADTANVAVVAGISPLINYETALAQAEANLARGRIVGCKLFPGHEAYFVNDQRLGRVFDLREASDVPLAVHTGWDNPQYTHPRLLAELAAARPGLRIVVCHLYWPDIDLCGDNAVGLYRLDVESAPRCGLPGR